MNNVLVTGGAGFIGSHLCEKLLKAGCTVTCLDNFNDSYSPSIKRDNVLNSCRHCCYKLAEGSILDLRLLDDLFSHNSFDAVIHLAALAGVRSSIDNAADYADVDIKGTVNLLEECRKHDIKKFVFASSSSVYGSNTDILREDMTADSQVSPYAAAKRSGELFCRTYNSLYGIPIACLRFFTVYGPRQRPDMAIYKFTEAILEGRTINIYGDGTSCRDYTYIDDITDGIIAAMNMPLDFEIFNLGNSEAVSITELIKVIEEKTGKKANINFLPEQPGDVPHTLADISKAERLLDYHPCIKLDEGIERFVRWYRLKFGGFLL